MKVLGTFEKAKRYIDSKTMYPGARVKYNTGPCITLSREAGAGSGLIAERVVDFLQPRSKDPDTHWGVFDKNLIQKVLEDHNLPKQIEKFMGEEKPPFFQQVMNEIFGVHPPLLTLHHKTTETIYELGSIGNVIIIGRGANIITASLNNAFHVRLVAPLDVRIKNVQDFYENTKQEAIEFIKKEDVKRAKFIKEHFNKNVEDSQLYHLIINTGWISIEETAEIISDAVVTKFPNFF